MSLYQSLHSLACLGRIRLARVMDWFPMLTRDFLGFLPTPSPSISQQGELIQARVLEVEKTRISVKLAYVRCLCTLALAALPPSPPPPPSPLPFLFCRESPLDWSVHGRLECTIKSCRFALSRQKIPEVLTTSLVVRLRLFWGSCFALIFLFCHHALNQS